MKEPLGSDNTSDVSEEISRTVSPPRRMLSYRGANLQGIGSRERQEDSFAFVNILDVTKMRENGLFAAAADGMGGMFGGKTASETAIAAVKDAFARFDMCGDISEQLRAAAVEANERVFSALGGVGGTTLAATVIYDEKLWFVSVGDSYIYLKRGSLLYRLNREQNIFHTRLLEAVCCGSTDRSLAENDPEKPALSQFIGMDELDDIDLFLRPFRLADGDVILICSDGVGGVLSEKTITEALSLSSPQIMCEALEQSIIAAAAPTQDNYTALVIQCSF